MTAIAAIVFRKKVYISGDSWVGDDFSQQLTPIPKVCKYGNLALGLCGAQRAMQQIRYVIQEAHEAGLDFSEDWVMRTFPDLLVRRLDEIKALGLNKEDDTAQVDAGAVIGVNGCLYVLESDFSVHKRVWYAAQGAGFSWITGALEALAMQKALKAEKPFGSILRPDSSTECREWLTLALKAAEAGCPAVKGPFHLVVV